MKIRCIVVDDEPHALGLVAGYVEKTSFLDLKGRFGNALDALDWVAENEVDLVFLDIDMPDLTGLEMSRMLRDGVQVVFTTAYDRYAVESYRVGALDYLLKPFNYAEFLEAAGKMRLLEKDGTRQGGTSKEEKSEFIFVKSDYKLKKILLQDVLYVEGLKDYIKIFTGPKPILTLMNLKAISQVLPGDTFLRVHRSFIVNLEKVDMVERSRILIAGTSIPVGEQYKEDFQAFLDSHTP